MANEKLVTLEQLGIVKNYIDTEDAKSIKSGEYANNTINLYTSTDKTGDPAVTFSLPEEMFLDQTKTVFVDNFVWSDVTYPDSTDPALDGKPVLVLAVKGDTSVSYSFVSLEKLIDIVTGDATNSINVTVSSDNKITADLKVSADEGNIAEVRTDGVYVPKTEVSIATTDEVTALFTNS